MKEKDTQLMGAGALNLKGVKRPKMKTKLDTEGG